MKLLYKKVLDKMRESSYFYEHMYFKDGDLIDTFFENGIFSLPEKEDLNNNYNNKGKIECIVEMLKVKTDKEYGDFKKCLSKNYKHVVDEMEKLELKLEQSCEDCLKFIQSLLKSEYSSQDGSSVSFDNIQKTILQYVRTSPKHHDTATLHVILYESDLQGCIKQAFPGANIKSEISQKTVTKNKNKKKQSEKVIVYGIEPRTRELKHETSTSTSDSSDGSDSDNDLVVTDEVPKRYFDVNEFAGLIKAIIDSNSIESSIAEKIKEQQVDSEIYELMSEAEKSELFPRIGERIRIRTEWEKIKNGKSTLPLVLNTTTQQENKESSFERLRRFDRPASVEAKYMQGSRVKVSTRPGNMLTPVHKYVSGNDITSFLPSLINFASACMNDRINGTFHVGISEELEVIGCQLDIDTIDTQITNAIKGRFKNYQVTIALKCIRPPQFIEVSMKQAKGETLHVIEVDVIPHHRIVESHAFFVKGKKGVFNFYRYQDDVIQLDHSEIDLYMQQERHMLMQQRSEIEKNKSRSKTENLNKKIKDFLCCGSDEFDESLYPVIVLGHLGSNNKNRFEDGGFFKDIPWRAVFDFNEKDDGDGFQNILEERHSKSFLTITVEDFNQKHNDEKSLRQTRDKITESSLPAWIYSNECNTNESQGDARTWIHHTSESFRKALEFYSRDIIPENRGRIIVPLFSKDNPILIEAIVEILLQFGRQCLIMCPSRSLASVCYNELNKRPNAFPPKSTIDDFFLIGLPWEQVNDCVRGILKSPKQYDGIQIPRSKGVPFIIEEKLVNELSDLEIVGINECRDIEELHHDEIRLKEQEVREDYYKGGSIQWYNFYFRDQVLVREVHPQLANHVRNALEGNDNECLPVEKVVVYHQPGSGGSTTSKHILWEMKSNYRCCVVKKITSQTCDQIGRFRLIGENDDEENDIKPVLVLLDNNNEDAITQFLDDLENESEKHNCDLFCVLLICFRVSALPLDKPSKYVMLRQELSQGENGEHHWFNEKNKVLLEHHKQKKGSHPRTLIGFNIMKDNFNMESIKKSVREFVSDRSISRKQMTLLKYISFLNSFDLHFQSIPISCFDATMNPPIQWVKQFPPPFKVLVSQCRRRQGYGGNITALRMSTYLLSRPVLDAVLEIEKENDGIQKTIGEVALDVMNSECFPTAVYKYEHKLLRSILGDIMKKRDRSSSNNGKFNKFSSLITELLDKKDSDLAIRIVSLTYDITDDPLVAQQLARLNGELENWEDGHKAIDEAIKQITNSSYLHHTKGQLYKEQLQIEFADVVKRNKSLPTFQVNTAISLARKALDCYHKSQELSETQDISQQNPAGYESKILMVIELLRLLIECPELRPLSSVFKGKLTNDNLIHARNLSFLTSLPEMVYVAVEKLERYLHGTNRRLFHSRSRSIYTVNKKQLDKHRQELAKFFSQGMTYNENPTAKIERPDVYSFLSALRFEDLSLILKHLEFMDMRSADLRHQDLRIYLAMYIALSMTHLAPLPVEPGRILSLSRKYLDTMTNRTELATLETYMYFISLHWPLESRKILEHCIGPYSKWDEALSAWLTLDNPQTTKQRRNEKLLFYLGNGKSFPGFVKIEDNNSIRHLERFKGVVNNNGTYVTVFIHSFQSDKGPTIKIPFYRKLGRSTLYNTKMEVIIGFGLQGPKADWLGKPSSFRLTRTLNTGNFQTKRKISQNVQVGHMHEARNVVLQPTTSFKNQDERYAISASQSRRPNQHSVMMPTGYQALDYDSLRQFDSQPSQSNNSLKAACVDNMRSRQGNAFSLQEEKNPRDEERRPRIMNSRISRQPVEDRSSIHVDRTSFARQASGLPPDVRTYEQTHARLVNTNRIPSRAQRPPMHQIRGQRMFLSDDIYQRSAMYSPHFLAQYPPLRPATASRHTINPSQSNYTPQTTQFQSQHSLSGPTAFQQNRDDNDQHEGLHSYPPRHF